MSLVLDVVIAVTQTVHRTGLPLSTYFSAIKLRWMLDNWVAVSQAHDADDLLFGTVESWIAYVRSVYNHVSLFLMHVWSAEPHRRYSQRYPY